MLSDPRFRIPVLFIVTVLLHVTLLPQLRIMGVMPDLLLLVAVAGGLVGGPARGAVLGFTAGIASDLFLATPMGLSALVFCLVGYAIGNAAEGMLRPARLFTMAAGGVGSAAGVGLFALAGATLGEGALLGSHLLVIMAVVGMTNGLLAPWMVRLVRWAVAPSGRPPGGSLGSGAGGRRNVVQA